MNSLELMRWYAISLCGTSYSWGGDDPIAGFDCSGLIQELLASIGMDPPGDQTAQGLYEYFSKFAHSTEKGLGAMVFFGRSINEITHIAMMISGHILIEAGGGGWKTVTPQIAAEQNAFVRLRPYGHRQDIVAVIRPYYASQSEDLA